MQQAYILFKISLKKLQQITSKYPLIILILLMTCVLVIVYKDVLIGSKVLFPANHMAHFYSPWNTVTFEGWEHGIPNKPIGTDPIRFFYPGWSFAISEVQAGRIPLWNPYIFTGNVHLADFQSALFFAPNWIYFILPQYLAWVLLHFLPYYLAVIGTYLFLRKLKLSASASAFGALLFAFSGYLISWNQENTVVPTSAALLPWVMLTVANCVDSSKKISFVLFAAIWALLFFAGHFQTAFYITAFAFFYFLTRTVSLNIPNAEKRKYLIHFGSFLLLGLGLSAIQLIPSFEAFSYSPRPSVDAFETIKEFLVPLTHIINIFVTDWYGNIGTYNYFGPGFYHETILSIAITGTIFAIYALYKRIRGSLFFAITALVTFFLTLDNPITTLLLSQPIPLISTFVPSRILLLTTFCLAVLAGYGFSEFFRETTVSKKKLLRKIILVTFSIILLANLLNLSGFIYEFIVNKETFLATYKSDSLLDSFKVSTQFVSLKNSITALTILAVLFILTFKRLALLVGIFLITLILQARLLNKLFMPGEKAFFYPDHFIFTTLQKEMAPDDRFIAYGKQVYPNLNLKWHLASPEGLDPIYNYRYGQLVDAANHNGVVDDSVPRVEARFNEFDGKEPITNDLLRVNVLSLLGVNYIAYYQDKQNSSLPLTSVFPPTSFLPVASQENWHIVKNTNALPHVFLTQHYLVETDMQKAVRLMGKEEFITKKTVILEQNPPSPIGAASENDKVGILTYESQLIKVKTSTQNTQLLFLSDSYFPGWEAAIDGNTTPIYRANTSFRAIEVPKGIHEVTFTYNPQSFKIGAIISLISLLILIFITLKTYRSK